MLQVEKKHYNFGTYSNKDRWLSYWHQIDEVLKSNAKSVLVIGVGDGIVPAVLQHLLENEGERSVFTFDIDETLKPNFVGDLCNIKKIVGDLRVDCILCSQVLEHLEYKYINKILESFSLLAKKVIISVPWSHRTLCHINIKLPKGKKMIIRMEIPKFYKTYQFDGQHYWELGTKKFSKKRFTRLLSQYFVLLTQYHVPEKPYHVFFLLQSKHFQ